MADSSFKSKLVQLAEQFQRDGYAVIENFLTDQEVQELRNETIRLVRDESRSNSKNIFGNEFNMRSKFFLDSADRVCYFFEKDAIDFKTRELKLAEEQSLAKIGHALHCLNPVFKKVTTSQKVKDVYKAIGHQDPTVVQSMVIFKNPEVGGAYTPHQDASFLLAEPTHLAGLWLALDDATPLNGCLEFIPGSHKWPLARGFVRTGNTEDGEDLLKWTSPPMEYDDNKFVKVPVKRGAMVVIDGLVVHRSAANKSNHPRWIYTFHAYDKGRSVYSDKNWLQPGPNDTFISIYAN